MPQGFNSMDNPGEYLQHYGVKGQKWGVRNWQNDDGSLTAAGRAHYGYGSARFTASKGETSQSNSNNKRTLSDNIRDKTRLVSKATSIASTAGTALTVAGLVSGFVPASALGVTITSISSGVSKANFAAKLANEVGSSVNTTIQDAKNTKVGDGSKKVTIAALIGAVGAGVGTVVGLNALQDIHDNAIYDRMDNRFYAQNATLDSEQYRRYAIESLKDYTNSSNNSEKYLSDYEYWTDKSQEELDFAEKFTKQITKDENIMNITEQAMDALPYVGGVTVAALLATAGIAGYKTYKSHEATKIANEQSSMTSSTYSQVKAMLNSGKSQKEIAKQLGISQATVSAINTGDMKKPSNKK